MLIRVQCLQQEEGSSTTGDSVSGAAGSSTGTGGVSIEGGKLKSSLEKGNGNMGDKIGGGKLLMSAGRGNENGKLKFLQESGN